MIASPTPLPLIEHKTHLWPVPNPPTTRQAFN